MIGSSIGDAAPDVAVEGPANGGADVGRTSFSPVVAAGRDSTAAEGLSGVNAAWTHHPTATPA
jgi:hypothetical protein